MKPIKIMSCGEVLWDLFPSGEKFGGAPANVACHAAVLGAEVTMVSAVGDDERGRKAKDLMRRFGVDTTFMPVIQTAPTGTVGITFDQSAKHTFTIHENSAWDRIAWAPALAAAVESVDAIYFGTLGQRDEPSRSTIRQVLTLAKKRGIPRMVDVNLRKPFFDDAMIHESIVHASLLKLSDDEIATVASACNIPLTNDQPATLRALLHKYELDLVVMTRGAEGALLITPHTIIDQPGIPTIVRDTVGAGDAFTAAFTLGHLRGDAPATNLRKACEIAAAVCAHEGAVPELG
jgi:fructokinase